MKRWTTVDRKYIYLRLHYTDLLYTTFLYGFPGNMHWTKNWIYIKFAQRKYDAKLCLP